MRVGVGGGRKGCGGRGGGRERLGGVRKEQLRNDRFFSLSSVLANREE